MLWSSKVPYDFGCRQGQRKLSKEFARVQKAYSKKEKNMGSYSTIYLMQEKAYPCAKFWGNLKGKHVESYGNLTLHDLFMHCKNLYELSLAGKDDVLWFSFTYVSRLYNWRKFPMFLLHWSHWTI